MAATNPVDHFSWFQKIGPLSHFPDHIVHAAFIGLLIVIASVLAHLQIKKAKTDVIPDRKLSLKNIFELHTEFILGVMKGVLPKNAEKYLPLLASIFLFIFLGNVIGLIPGFQPPTANLNTNLAIGLTVFLYYNYLGVKEHKWGYLKHFLGPLLPLAPLMLLIELISHSVRPISLSLRLYGNMTGDHTVLNIFSNMWPYIGVPVIFLALGLLVCFIQAFVFTLLSVVYIALATAHEEH